MYTSILHFIEKSTTRIEKVYGDLIAGKADLATLSMEVEAEVLKLNRLDAPDLEPVCASVARTGRLLVLEDSARAGGMGTRILAELARRGVSLRAQRLLDLGDGVVPHGEVAQLRAMLGLDAAGVVRAAGELVRG